MESVEIVRVKFRWPGKIIEFRNPDRLVLKRGDKVVVETFRGGTMVGEVSVAPRLRMKRVDDDQLTVVLRNAGEQDLRTDRITDEFRLDVKNFFRQRLQAQQMPGVKLIDIERADGGQKLIIYYSCEQKRFDPRVLSKELGQRFGMRIDMRTVGVRDAARLAGGIGKCGLSTCCSTWLPDFQAVSIRMAKDQGLSLDPDSINGQCGRLLCCLGYENENYKALVKDLPKVGKMVVTPAGEGRVTKLDVLQGTVSVRMEDGSYEMFKGTDVQRKFPAQGERGGRDDDDGDDSGAPREQRPRGGERPPRGEGRGGERGGERGGNRGERKAQGGGGERAPRENRGPRSGGGQGGGGEGRAPRERRDGREGGRGGEGRGPRPPQNTDGDSGNKPSGETPS